MNENLWPDPKKRMVGLFTDLRLYYDALDIADLYGEFSKSRLEEGLSKRVKGLIYIEKLSARVVNDLTRELIDFGWIKRKAKPLTSKTQDVFLLTKNGKEIMQAFRSDIKVYRRQLILKMHELYTIPGWFVNRLWEVNPQGQGEIVIPAPLRKWNPESRKWEDNKWGDELSQQVMDSFILINKVCPCAFPIKKKPGSLKFK
jgi:predicted transcriptional regulator